MQRHICNDMNSYDNKMYKISPKLLNFVGVPDFCVPGSSPGRQTVENFTKFEISSWNLWNSDFKAKITNILERNPDEERFKLKGSACFDLGKNF